MVAINNTNSNTASSVPSASTIANPFPNQNDIQSVKIAKDQQAPEPKKTESENNKTIPSTQVTISQYPKPNQDVEGTSLQYTTDKKTGKSVINVLSTNDNSVLRTIELPVKMNNGEFQTKKVTPELVKSLLA
jgi:uncharacterized FlaG/YvyC family protein